MVYITGFVKKYDTELALITKKCQGARSRMLEPWATWVQKAVYGEVQKANWCGPKPIVYSSTLQTILLRMFFS